MYLDTYDLTLSSRRRRRRDFKYACMYLSECEEQKILWIRYHTMTMNKRANVVQFNSMIGNMLMQAKSVQF